MPKISVWGVTVEDAAAPKDWVRAIGIFFPLGETEEDDFLGEDRLGRAALAFLFAEAGAADGGVTFAESVVVHRCFFVLGVASASLLLLLVLIAVPISRLRRVEPPGGAATKPASKEEAEEDPADEEKAAAARDRSLLLVRFMMMISFRCTLLLGRLLRSLDRLLRLLAADYSS